jgi:hypothetical protein
VHARAARAAGAGRRLLLVRCRHTEHRVEMRGAVIARIKVRRSGYWRWRQACKLREGREGEVRTKGDDLSAALSVGTTIGCGLGVKVVGVWWWCKRRVRKTRRARAWI